VPECFEAFDQAIGRSNGVAFIEVVRAELLACGSALQHVVTGGIAAGERGVVVLLRNSNPDSSVYQAVNTSAGPLFTVVAASLTKWQDRLVRGITGWSSLGVTVAATHAQDTEQVRLVLPSALFLVLGYGAQGASAREAVRGFRRGPAGLEGGIVSASRPILFPDGSTDVSALAWERGMYNALARATTELGEAVA
jgi:orotidine-5'-phosphate decarboxylase